jgi:predicted AAA+ superfamily ATPase
LNYTISYWRTASQVEVDFILGDHEVAVEVKGTKNVQSRDVKGLKSFAEEYKVKKGIVVSNDPVERLMGNVLIMPWKIFLEKLWAGEIIA